MSLRSVCSFFCLLLNLILVNILVIDFSNIFNIPFLDDIGLIDNIFLINIGCGYIFLISLISVLFFINILRYVGLLIADVNIFSISYIFILLISNICVPSIYVGLILVYIAGICIIYLIIHVFSPVYIWTYSLFYISISIVNIRYILHILTIIYNIIIFLFIKSALFINIS